MPKFGDSKKMPCSGSSDCKGRNYTVWIWTDGHFKNYWKCTVCGRTAG